MPILSGLHIYPIKSCAGLSLQRARVTRWGLEWDRHWMVVDINDGFVTQRTYPDMARIVPSFEGNKLVVRAEGMPALELSLEPDPEAKRRIVSVWDDAFPALDEGNTAAEWFSELLDSTLRLVRFDRHVPRPVSKKWTGEYDSLTQFADGFPMLVTGEASLDELNGRLTAKGAPAIPMNRFRPNIVLSGLDAYDEDFIGNVTVSPLAQVNDANVGQTAGPGEPVVREPVVLRLSKPCARCPIPTINQADGSRDPNWPHEPLDTMASYRANALVGGGLTFGQNAIAIQGEGEWLEVGSTVDAEYNFS